MARFSANVFSHAPPLLREPQRGQPAHRARPRLDRARHVRARLQPHARPVEPAHAGPSTDVLFPAFSRDPGRRAPRSRRPGSASPASIGAVTVPAMLGPDRRRAGVRGRRARGQVEPGDPARAAARLGRAPPVAPGPQLEHPPRARPHRDAAALRRASSRSPPSRRSSAGSTGASSASRPPTRSRARSSSRTTPGSPPARSTPRSASFGPRSAASPRRRARWRSSSSRRARGPDRAGRLERRAPPHADPLGIVVYLPLLAWREPEVLGELRALRTGPIPRRLRLPS